MLLIVIRHGLTTKGGELSPEGLRQVERLSDRLWDLGARVERAVSATSLASTSTASMLLDRLGRESPLDVRPLAGRALAPPKSRRFLSDLVTADRHTLIVGGEDILEVVRSLIRPVPLGHGFGRLLAVRGNGVLRGCWGLGPIAIEKQAA